MHDIALSAATGTSRDTRTLAFFLAMGAVVRRTQKGLVTSTDRNGRTIPTAGALGILGVLLEARLVVEGP